MLKDDFFSITAINIESDSIDAILELNEKHKIFKGHFPGHPVVPGACMFQMVKEITKIAVGSEIQLRKADDIKFLMMLNPNENKIIQAKLNYKEENGKINISASFLKGNSICFKFKGMFQAKNLPG